MKTIWEVKQEEAVVVGSIIHVILIEGVEEAFRLYPDYTDFILDFMNTEFYKQIQKPTL